ncbi:MAG TPA: PEP/pyruvate-binding domain-containing protein [Sandaracinaceae bacterium LLY-WYZ-13_1]|nr:PEP/pyruvate-binding domain-containing protein [Sandaracinaceae bacterium LLY-WYZ-13_1]
MAPRRTFGLLFLTTLLLSCGGRAPEARAGLDPDVAAPRIDDLAAWESLAARPRNHHVARTEVVKFVYDLRGETPVPYFLQSERFENHYDFVRAHLTDGWADGMAFYRDVYRTEDRPFIVGSLVRYVDADAYTFELVSGDTLAGPRILRTLERLREDTFFGDRLRFRPTSDAQIDRIAGLDALPVADDEELYGAQRYQPVQLGVAYGTLRIVRGAVPRGRLGPGDVLVTDEVPDDLPLVAALITSRFQAPLAHVAVLSSNRGTPDMALREAVDDPALASLEGRLVRIEVGAQDFQIRAATPEEARAHRGDAPVRPPFVPALDTSRADLLEQCELDFEDLDVAGAKAVNMGELCRLDASGVEVPRGFVVPFARYIEHLARHRIDARVRAFLASDARQGDPTEPLAELREAIASAPVDRALVRAVRDRIRAVAPGGRVRLRSSTNAEDLPGFSGAGLYSSAVLDADASDEAIARGVAGIWASVWNLGAFQERELYRIDHARVAMAVLVQKSVDDTVGNGVAITANPYDRQRRGVLINVQAPGASVTGARGDQIPEQWLVFTYLPAREPELLARSSLTDGRPILRRAEVLDLTRQLEAIHARFLPRFAEHSNAIDVEFLVTERERDVVMVQARPFRVSWQGR